ALPAMFIGILVISMIDRNKIKLDLVVAILAVIIAVGSSFLFSSSVGVIIATVIASTTGMVFEKWK
ncbi:branched-chain amino acid transporter AzlC, partial [Paenibacillus odorifer]